MNQNSTEEKSDCENSLVLPSLDTLSSIRGGLFMMETSGRDRLTARQACAVESAAAQSDLQVFFIYSLFRTFPCWKPLILMP